MNTASYIILLIISACMAAAIAVNRKSGTCRCGGDCGSCGCGCDKRKEK